MQFIVRRQLPQKVFGVLSLVSSRLENGPTVLCSEYLPTFEVLTSVSTLVCDVSHRSISAVR